MTNNYPCRTEQRLYNYDCHLFVNHKNDPDSYHNFRSLSYAIKIKGVFPIGAVKNNFPIKKYKNGGHKHIYTILKKVKI